MSGTKSKSSGPIPALHKSAMQEEIRRIRVNEEKALRAAQFKKQRDEALAEFTAQAEKDKIFQETKEGPITNWQQVVADADKATNANLQSYNTWAACMGELLNMYIILNKAIDNSIRLAIGIQIRAALKQALLYPLIDKIKNKLTGDPAVDLPQLQHFVSMGDDNVLKLEPLVRSDGGTTNMSSLDALFKKGIEDIWLKECGYHPDKENPGKYLDQHGAVLTKAEFEHLKEDSLEAFLSRQHAGVRFSPR